MKFKNSKFKNIESKPNYLWQIKYSIKSIKQLQEYFYFPTKQKNEIDIILKNTRMSITPYLLNLMKIDENNSILKDDPIWLQYGPSNLETDLLEIKTSWEISDELFADGLGQHKYPDKVVIRIAHHCASYCRFCYERGRTLNNSKPINAKDKAITYIKNHPKISEVILTGGDLLALNDEILGSWINCFNNIKTINSIRIHTRMPAQNPYRITPELIKILMGTKVKKINIQVNHPRELTNDFFKYLKLLQKIGINIKTENPIIHKVNDDYNTLAKIIHLCRANNVQHHHWFHSMPITPYSMRISIEKLVLLFQELKKELGGIRWNSSELGDLVIPHRNGKRTVPFEEINIDINKPREEWGTKNFIFTINDNEEAIVRFSSWDQNSKDFFDYIDPKVNLKDYNKSDFVYLIKNN